MGAVGGDLAEGVVGVNLAPVFHGGTVVEVGEGG